VAPNFANANGRPLDPIRIVLYSMQHRVSGSASNSSIQHVRPVNEKQGKTCIKVKQAGRRLVFDPKLKYFGKYAVAKILHSGPPWGAPATLQIWWKSDDRILRNGEKPNFWTLFFSDFVTESRIWRQPPKSFTELSGPFYTEQVRHI